MKNTELATLGAGCFWGVEDLLRKVEGVLSATCGYCGGKTESPSYKDICTGQTGHAEVVQIEFDSTQISFETVLDYFFRLHDPTTLNRQGPDSGTQYRSVIYCHSEEQEKKAIVSKEKWQASGKFKNPIVTEIAPAQKFYPAEEYHQRYFERNGGISCHYLRD
ncbi:MAG: peptide-methionine (S)-S-oxide reductase MsrA [Pseudomonadota bacterium]|nr:peptide-methionine (S)-S-oxide reductase MsrA [Pseudomonadota bacterium]